MMKLKNHVVILAFILITIKVNGQDTLTSATVEQKSYQLYIDKNWNELIKFGTNAINKGYNYYYLQLRVGIAYYEKKTMQWLKDIFLTRSNLILMMNYCWSIFIIVTYLMGDMMMLECGVKNSVRV